MPAPSFFSFPSGPESSPVPDASDLDPDDPNRYADEFADLVRRNPPSHDDGAVVDWMKALPDGVYETYRRGIESYGCSEPTGDERRGRLYLTHTALLFMWISWGETTARDRFRTKAREATRRAAHIATLELYRRAGVLRAYTIDHWFESPVERWGVVLDTRAVDAAHVEDADLADALDSLDAVAGTVALLSRLRAAGAVPSPSDL
jgi:hypothetical protein